MKKTFIFDCQITTHALKKTKKSGKEVFFDAASFLDMQRQVQEHYELDKVCTIYDVYNIESIVLGQRVKYFDWDLPAIDSKDALIKEKKDISKIRGIDFQNHPRSRFVLDLIDLYKEEIGKGFKPRFCAPFSLAVNLRGYDQLICDIYTDRNFVDEFFTVLNHEVLSPWIRVQRERAGKDAIASGADAWVSIPNVNLKILNEIILPKYSDLYKTEKNLYFSIMDGARYLQDPIEYLRVQKKLNPFLVKGFDPDIKHVGIEHFIDFADTNDMDLLLGIEPAFLMNASLDAIAQRIKEYVQKGIRIKKDFILYFNDIPADITEEKLHKIFETVKTIRRDLQ